MPTAWWLRPVKNEHGWANTARSHGIDCRAPGGQSVDVGRSDVRAEAPEVCEPGVVEDDGDNIGGPLGRLRIDRAPRLGFGG